MANSRRRKANSRTSNTRTMTTTDNPKRDMKGRSKSNRNAKNIRRDDEIEGTIRRERESISTGNDVQWYSNFPQFAKDVATLPFSTPLGNALDLASDINAVAHIERLTVVPGLMRLGFFPTIGVSDNLSSAVNRSSLRYYSALRNKQKASAPYDQADSMMAMIALDSLYMLWAHMRRAYGVAQLYSPINRYYPKALLQAMGVSTTILDHLAEFRVFINRFAISLGQFATPKFDMLLRHQWMCSGIYSDAQSTRAQTYCFVPEGFWQYDNTAEVGTTLKWIEWNDPKANNVKQHTLEEIQSMANSMIAALAGDEDIGRITGDIFAAFGESNTYKVEETLEGYTVLPAYNPLVLAQIENCVFCNGWATGYTPLITQNPSINNGAIIFQPQFEGSFITTTNNVTIDFRMACQSILNCHGDNPTPEFVLEASRLVFNAEMVVSDGRSYLKPHSIGSDVITNARIWVVNPFTGNNRSLKINTNAIYVTETGDTQLADLIGNMAPFDWHPILYVMSDNNPAAGTQDDYLHGFFGDIDNLAPLPSTQLEMMHEAAMLSLFDLPINLIEG